MDERERDYLVQRIRELEQIIRRWKLATSAVAAALVIALLVGLLSFFPLVQVLRERNEAMRQLDQARAMEAARLQAEQKALMERQATQRAEKLPKKE